MNIAVHPDSFLNTPGPHGKTCEKGGPIATARVELTEQLRWEDDGGALLPAAANGSAVGFDKNKTTENMGAGMDKRKSDDNAGKGGKLTWLQYAGKRSFQEKIKPDHALAKFAVLLGQCRKSVQPAGKAA